MVKNRQFFALFCAQIRRVLHICLSNSTSLSSADLWKNPLSSKLMTTFDYLWIVNVTSLCSMDIIIIDLLQFVYDSWWRVLFVINSWWKYEKNYCRTDIKIGHQMAFLFWWNTRSLFAFVKNWSCTLSVYISQTLKEQILRPRLNRNDAEEVKNLFIHYITCFMGEIFFKDRTDVSLKDYFNHESDILHSLLPSVWGCHWDMRHGKSCKWLRHC